MPTEDINKRAEPSWPRILEESCAEVPRAKASTVRRIYANKTAEAVASIGILAISAAVFYRVRELLAALLLFSVLIGVVIVAVLILWLVGEATREATSRIETRLAHIPARHVLAASRAHATHNHRSPPWN